MSGKKFLCIFIISILLLFVLEIVSFVTESMIFVSMRNDYNKKIENEKTKVDEHNYWQPGYRILKDFPINDFRPSSYKNTKKNPILWFGCSFADGAGMDDNKTPCFKISDLTGRTCINRAQGATGTQYIYNQIKKNDFKKIAPDVDFIFYIFIQDHLRRLYFFQIPLTYYSEVRYQYKNHELKEVPRWTKYLYSSYLIQKLAMIRIKYCWDKEFKNYYLFNIVMKETAKEFKKIYPNAKFIMIEFNEKRQTEFLPEEEIKKLNSYGIDVVRLRDYIGDIDIHDDKYWFEDDCHPREVLWDMLLPQIVKKYNM
ncbi:MAG: hypothetical protein K6C94_06075 [Candidatus Gastranaerophilales bacterium]|nr:hypothetical protein [Candidatus Gastranaerophilales bacterium]